jgi:hypothetical protein
MQRKKNKCLRRQERNSERDQASSSKVRPEVREYGMPLAFDQSASPKEGKEVSKAHGILIYLY